MSQPDQYLIDKALEVAAWSPCQKSRRGVVIWDPANGAHRGSGFNGPPIGFVCQGREACRGTCALRCVHAEMRALEEAVGYIARHHPPGPYDLLHVELATDGSVVPCDGPSCAQCSKHIVDSEFISGVWLFERAGCPHCEAGEIPPDKQCKRGAGGWRRYDVAEFHRLSLNVNRALASQSHQRRTLVVPHQARLVGHRDAGPLFGGQP